VWSERKKRHTVTLKVDDYEYEIIKDIAESFESTKGEAVRRALWVFRVLYDRNLRVKDALKPSAFEGDIGDKALFEILKPIPELSAVLGLELKRWRRESIEKARRRALSEEGASA